MRRRDFISLIGGMAAWPRVTCAQQAGSVTTIGFLSSGGALTPSTLAAIRQGLRDMGYVEGRNLAIEIRATEQYDQMPILAAE